LGTKRKVPQKAQFRNRKTLTLENGVCLTMKRIPGGVLSLRDMGKRGNHHLIAVGEEYTKGRGLI